MLSPPSSRRLVSVSRRTDIPAHYAQWFVNRIHEGFVLAPNPWMSKATRVELVPDAVMGLVFWSKDYAPLLPLLDQVEALTGNLYFHFTITGLPGWLEPGSPDPGEAVEDLARLSRRYSPDHVAWRFDPLCLTDSLPREEHLERFTRLASRLAGLVRRVVVSFMHPYRKVERRWAMAGAEPVHVLSGHERAGFAARLAEAASKAGMALSVCCDPEAVGETVTAARCIGAPALARAWDSGEPLGLAPGPTRPGCGCHRSVDIGAYDTCPAGCLYCYANAGHERAAAFAAGHDPGAACLGHIPGPDE